MFRFHLCKGFKLSHFYNMIASPIDRFGSNLLSSMRLRQLMSGDGCD